jgi:mRNA deadenylase 3'-5' endonuclease subunit Ccr4
LPRICSFFKPELYVRGYDSVYVKRPSINVSNWSGEKKHDGCGIFYKCACCVPICAFLPPPCSHRRVVSSRKDKFELKECETFNFHDPHDRVAIMALLKMRHFAQFVLVGCTHLWWNSKYVATL